MISVSEYITTNNPEGGMSIIEKYGIKRPSSAKEMVETLNYIGRKNPESKVEFVRAHPDYKTFHSFYGETYNLEGETSIAAEPNKIPVSFYKQHEGIIMVAAAIVIAAFILKK